MSQKFLPVGVEENKNKNEKRKDPKIQRVEEKNLIFLFHSLALENRLNPFTFPFLFFFEIQKIPRIPSIVRNFSRILIISTEISQ